MYYNTWESPRIKKDKFKQLTSCFKFYKKIMVGVNAIGFSLPSFFKI